MNIPAAVRIDKWLWAVRLYKTRTLAATACRNGHVTIGGQSVKPSREVKINDLILAQTGDITRTVKVLALLERRVSAPAVKNFAEDLTPASEYNKPRERILEPIFYRPKGAGRPTKKERRAINKFISE
jgi:ribosome-associated heat shock protein Hsp15